MEAAAHIRQQQEQVCEDGNGEEGNGDRGREEMLRRECRRGGLGKSGVGKRGVVKRGPFTYYISEILYHIREIGYSYGHRKYFKGSSNGEFLEYKISALSWHCHEEHPDNFDLIIFKL